MVATQEPRDFVLRLTRSEVERMSDGELLRAVWLGESTYKRGGLRTKHDHRRHLERKELEHVFYIVQHLVRRRSPR
jgi:hypothetical protein